MKADIDLLERSIGRMDKAIERIEAMLQLQAEDLFHIRSQVQRIVDISASKSNPVIVDPDCGYEWLGAYIQIDAETWDRIKSGEHVTIKGIGWVPGDEGIKPDPSDPNFHWDTWEFNGGIGKPMKFTMQSPLNPIIDSDDAIAYEGPLLKKFIYELDDC